MKKINFSRKGTICSCLVTVIDENNKYLDNATIKYQVEPNKDKIIHKNYKDRLWSEKSMWGKFIKVTELPEVFKNFSKEDIKIEIGYFTRDKILMPYVANIQIVDGKKYRIIKNQLNRRDKLNKIKSK